MSAFDIDGKFFRGLTKAGDFFILGALTVVASLPVVTIGPALTAANYVALRTVRDEEGYVWKNFWRSFKQNFKQGFLIELIMVIIGLVLFMDLRASAYWAYKLGSQVGLVFMYGVIGIFIIYAAVLLYVFAVLAQFDNKVIATIKNALILCTHHLPQTLIMVVATYGILYFSVIYFTALIVTIPLLLYVDAFILSRVFRPFLKQAEQQNMEDETDYSEYNVKDSKKTENTEKNDD